MILSNGSEDTYTELKKDPPFISVQLLEILKLQLPQTLSFLTRMIFYIKLKPEASNFKCCSSIKNITWMSLKLLIDETVHNIWGPELIQYARVLSSDFADFSEKIEEFSLDDV